ncbi:hypothetical protein H6798_01980 [Candidatus Nomurabacteria bacterium]|nr:hypothetical protein [Candidatus Nomurabacteria bacterium]
MARVEISDGPSPWHLMLAMFDPHPENAHGERIVIFRLKVGPGWPLNVKVRGVVRPKRESMNDPWTIVGDAMNLPRGYYYYDGLEVHWDPFGREGWIDLELTSSCHAAVIRATLADGILAGYCSRCDRPVTRIHPVSGKLEWLDGASLWSNEVHEEVVMLYNRN